MSTLLGQFRRIAAAVVMSGLAASLGAEPASKASNFGSISNTRHNLTQSYLGANAGWMNLSRNNYGEVCVYCHTPHGASGKVELPLWNRTIRQTTYTTYEQLGTSSIGQAYSQPGPASLACLSCHDGQTAIDSIINMPGSGRFNSSQDISQNSAFLDSWPGGPGSSFYGGHGTLSNSPAALGNYGECMACHSPSGDQHDPSFIPNFDAAYISTDLRDDHPVGVTYPASTGTGTDWMAPSGTRMASGRSTTFFDVNGNARMDKDEIRLYDSGEGPEVECASCHDPHGVPSAEPGRTFNRLFLRRTNEGSEVCLTCHSK